MASVYPVTFPDGKVRKALVARVDRSTQGCIIDGECYLYGCTEYGVVRRSNVVYHVVRRQKSYSDPWTPWVVTRPMMTRTRNHRPPFAPEVIEEAVRIAQQEPRTASTLARILDGKTFGWDDAKAWQYLTRMPPRPEGDTNYVTTANGRYLTRKVNGRVEGDAWWVYCGITEAVALARMALRRVGGNFDPPPAREVEPGFEALLDSMRHSHPKAGK